MSKKAKNVVLASPFEALNEKHALVAETFQDMNQVLLGSSGTGKTYTLLRLALQEVLTQGNDYYQIIIVRSSVPTRDVGFLKGSLEDKISAYEMPYADIINKVTKPMPLSDKELFDSNYDKLKETGRIKFVNTSYLRGTTFDNSIVLFDEVQSATFHELDTVITRLGTASKLLMAGDYRQDDLKKGQSGLHNIMKVLEKMESYFNIIEFTPEDVVRSGLVKDYLITKDKLGL